MSPTRRQLLSATAIFTIAGTGFMPSLIAAAKADDAAPSATDLADAGPDGDVMVGSDKAPVTIIEYASMTCPHCAHFSATTFPELQKKYIDTGKVRYTLRAFPLDALAAAGFMLARCAGNDKYMPMVETLFAKQADWVVKEPLPPLKEIAKQFGMTEDSFNACLANSEGSRCHPGGARPCRRQARGELDTHLLYQRQEVHRRPDDGSDVQGDRPLSQGRIRVFRLGPAPLKPFSGLRPGPSSGQVPKCPG